ncbi:polycomb protein Pcl [Maniola hyperantus]|uniref:polycomb protein Pcl n=1 Tax=Aphantopus hyperantus TaxID=2795564 RepID=UPI001568BAAB|nr:polycomb protein Pcl isoform X1 [Maniola hyperantus]
MDINAEVSTQLSLIDALLNDFDKTITPCTNKKNEKKEEETQDAMPDSTTNTEKNNGNPFHCGDDVLVPNKDGRYYLGTIVELSTSNDNDSCEVGTGLARCLVKFGDGTHAWAAVSSLKLLSAPPADDGRIMCVVCKRRDGPAASPAANAIIACDMCGRGYHAKCHTPPVEAWISGASWHCKRCVEQRYRVAAAENRALKRSDLFRFKGGQQRRQQQELTPPCDTASTTSTASEAGKDQHEAHCYCGDKSDWLAQMLLCCRCSRWFHQRCVSSLQYPLYAGDKLYIFACANCNGGAEYLRRLELCWLELAHLALFNLTAYNAPNYFDLDTVIMPYIMDNWHALQLPEKMWRTPVTERREKILTALTSSRKRFKCGREMKKRATIWGLRLRRPPPPPLQLSALEQVKEGEPLTDKLVREYAPRLRFLCRAPSPHTEFDDSLQPSSSNNEKSSYKSPTQRMIVPVDGHWLNLMMGKRFHENLNSNSNSENDSASSYESVKTTERDEQLSPSVCSSTARKSDAKDDALDKVTLVHENESNEAKSICENSPVPSLDPSSLPCSVQLDKIPKDAEDINSSNDTCNINVNTHTSRIATMNLEVSKLSTKNIIEHSKIMSLQHMDSLPPYSSSFNHEVESSGDETSSRGTLDAIIPPLKDFQGKNNPFLMKNTYPSKTPFSSNMNLYNKQNGRSQYHSRFSLPNQLNPLMGPMIRPLKRKLSEKDIVIGPNGEVKRRKYRRPRKHLQLQLNKSCPLPDDASKTAQMPTENGDVTPPAAHSMNNVKFHGRRLRQRPEKNYYENARRNTTNSASSNNSVKSLQLSPHKASSGTAEVDARQLSALKSSVQSYFRAGQTFRVLARRVAPGHPPAYLIEWDSAS